MESEYLKYAECVSSTELHMLMNEYGNEVWRYAYAITKNHEQAKDIAQEVFIKAYYNIHTFRGQSSLKTWLFTITRNLAINEMRSSYFRKIFLFENVKYREAAQSAEIAYMEQQTASDIWAIIMQLSRKLREVLVLDLEHELSMQEMAQLLNISAGTVKSRLYRARKEVERKWREQEQ
ncbi:ECF RNA polymerase sigma factor SigW [Paenibacillus plantiphilus]|uniref:ECF RNA polymerase sigma factor SigW n=1 Tax=Paenibacillus plantiphilus TaxID=2905650 RepID=A0ABM9C0U9_9BACL|nr:RNA polymerase sigma factor [Paenibacillus plantiphilus]CAH1200531.1 ECF RNA polymerase sigma factor SigW [Paenibacillus plantiphilus]